MIKRRFGKTDVQVPVIGQGTWSLPTEGDQIAAAIESIKTGIELGMTHIDTAEMYGEGQSEEIIAQAIKGFPREELFIVSKVLPANGTYDKVIKACEQSLKRLGVDYLDSYLLHWRESVPLSETIRGLEKLIDDGKIRTMGVSNFDVYDMEEALAIANKPIACNQILYNLLTRSPERRLMPFCAKNNVAIVAYTPFARKSISHFSTEYGAALSDIAKKHDATVSQIILAFLVRDQNLFTIPKASAKDHARDNALAGDIILSQIDIETIDKAFPAPKKAVPLETL